MLNVPDPALYDAPGVLMVIDVIFPVASVVAVPAKPLPPPGGVALNESVLLFCLAQVPAGICTPVMQPALAFMFTVPVAFVMVFVLGEVVKDTVGVIPDV
jgi:hypothetical protein